MRVTGVGGCGGGKDRPLETRRWARWGALRPSGRRAVQCTQTERRATWEVDGATFRRAVYAGS